MDYSTIGLVGVGVIGAAVVWTSFNKVQALDERCEMATRDIDVQMKHRHDLLPNLVEMVRGAIKQENEIFQSVLKLQRKALQAHSQNARFDAETNLGNSITNLISMADKVPELRASAHFRQLREDMIDANERITATRRFLNLAVNEFNTTRRQFPAVLIANVLKLEKRAGFDLGFERAIIDEQPIYKF